MDQYPMPTESLAMEINGISFIARPKRFSTGSVGWYLSCKEEMEGERVQISMSITVIGSKPKTVQPEERVSEPAPVPKEPAQTPQSPSNGQERVKGRPKSSKPV